MCEKQMEHIISHQKHFILSAKTPEDMAMAYGVWVGFINGLRLTNAIDHDEYSRLYDEICRFYRAANAA